jgi:hypothetical protein
MNKISKITIAGATGTTVMTAGSQLMSFLFEQNFSEPDHLETMIERLAPLLSGHAKK